MIRCRFTDASLAVPDAQGPRDSAHATLVKPVDDPNVTCDLVLPLWSSAMEQLDLAPLQKTIADALRHSNTVQVWHVYERLCVGLWLNVAKSLRDGNEEEGQQILRRAALFTWAYRDVKLRLNLTCSTEKTHNPRPSFVLRRSVSTHSKLLPPLEAVLCALQCGRAPKHLARAVEQAIIYRNIKQEIVANGSARLLEDIVFRGKTVNDAVPLVDDRFTGLDILLTLARRLPPRFWHHVNHTYDIPEDAHRDLLHRMRQSTPPNHPRARTTPLLFMAVSYPTADDRARARAEGITPQLLYRQACKKLDDDMAIFA